MGFLALTFDFVPIFEVTTKKTLVVTAKFELHGVQNIFGKEIIFSIEKKIDRRFHEMTYVYISISISNEFSARMAGFSCLYIL